MRALVLVLLLAGCGEPPLSAEARYPDYLDMPSRGPADNIADIGAVALCREPAFAVTEESQEGLAVTSCAADPEPAPPQSSIEPAAAHE